MGRVKSFKKERKCALVRNTVVSILRHDQLFDFMRGQVFQGEGKRWSVRITLYFKICAQHISWRSTFGYKYFYQRRLIFA